MIWTPHLTVAAVIERDGHFLMVEEESGGRTVINQPAGHVEKDEYIPDAAIRETLEETAWQFTPEHITGFYQWRKPETGPSFLRVCFTGSVANHNAELKLDEGIIAAKWISYDELCALPETRLRSPMVLRCIEDYLSGNRYPMDMIHEMESR